MKVDNIHQSKADDEPKPILLFYSPLLYSFLYILIILVEMDVHLINPMNEINNKDIRNR